MEYEFTLKYKLGENGPTADAIMTDLAAAECTDALVGLGMPGYVSLEFVREATDAPAAILSALREVKKALPKAELVEAGPHYVGLTDVADLLGMSRQNMRKLFQVHASSFPSPVHGGSSMVWHLALVLDFLRGKNYGVNDNVANVAKAAMEVNVIRQQAAVKPNSRFQKTVQEELNA